MADKNSDSSKIIVTFREMGAMMTNCYCIRREDSTSCIIVDPGWDGERIYRILEDRGHTCDLILLTHAHFDHVGGLDALKELSGATVCASENEKRLCSDPEMNLTADIKSPSQVQPDRWLRDGEIVESGGVSLTVMATPGHTEGSCCYYCSEGGFLISGDTMFFGSHGRTDFPTGDDHALFRSIKRLLDLPSKTVVYPGHDSPTTIGREHSTYI